MLTQLDRFSRCLLPVFLAIVSIIVGFVALPTSYSIISSFAVMSLYHWSIYRPHLFPPLVAFLLGLLYDLFSGTPFGITAFIFVLIQWIVSSQRRFLTGQTFLMIWWGFLLMTLSRVFIEWAMISLIHTTLIAPKTALLKALLEVALFPLVVHFILFPLTHFTASKD